MHDRVAKLRAALEAAGVPHLANPSHIVPVIVGDPVQCKSISDQLLDRFGIYVQPINHPTVQRGTERLRITPSPLHSDADIDHLIASLDSIWTELHLERADIHDDEGGLPAIQLAAIRPALITAAPRPFALEPPTIAARLADQGTGFIRRLLARLVPAGLRRAYG